MGEAIQQDSQGRKFVHDHRGREMREGNRVRGNYLCGAEAHGFVRDVYSHPKHGPVLVIVDREDQEHNLPASRCRRMKGDTQAIAQARKNEEVIAARKAARKPAKRVARRK